MADWSKWKKAMQQQKEDTAEDKKLIAQRGQEACQRTLKDANELNDKLEEKDRLERAGKAVPDEKSEFTVRLDKNDFINAKMSPFAQLAQGSKNSNKYGYTLNINHPVILKCYRDYQKFVNESMALSDMQRFDFEKIVNDELERIGVTRIEFPPPVPPKDKYGYSR